MFPQLFSQRNFRCRFLRVVHRQVNCPIAKKTTPSDLARLIEKGFAAAKDDLNDLKHELKGDIARVQQQVNSIEAQLRETKIEIRLGNLEDKVFGAPRR